jgi:hypothetical protein
VFNSSTIRPQSAKQNSLLFWCKEGRIFREWHDCKKADYGKHQGDKRFNDEDPSPALKSTWTDPKLVL